MRTLKGSSLLPLSVKEYSLTKIQQNSNCCVNMSPNNHRLLISPNSKKKSLERLDCQTCYHSGHDCVSTRRQWWLQHQNLNYPFQCHQLWQFPKFTPAHRKSFRISTNEDTYCVVGSFPIIFHILLTLTEISCLDLCKHPCKPKLWSGGDNILRATEQIPNTYALFSI